MTKKTPARRLSHVACKVAREADAHDGDLDGFLRGGERTEQAALPSDEMPASARVSDVLATSMLLASLPRRAVARIGEPSSLALVVGVPGPDWITPIARALFALRSWAEVTKRSGANRTGDKPSVGNDAVAAALGSGGSVLGVSTSPERYLPSALMAAADLRVDIAVPSPRALRSTIRIVTGRRVGPFPGDLMQGLGFDEIASCIRKGSKPGECIRRLKAASASKRAPGPDLAEVPFLEDTWGYGAAKEHGLALVESVKAHRRGECAWEDVGPKRFVLAGPPGTGKTSLARSIAKSLNVNLTATTVSSWFSQSPGYLNDICRKVDEVFMEASHAGGVLLIDELDSIPSRETCDSRNRDFWVAVVSHVLTTLDGAVSSPASRLIIIGATNFPDRLDPALTRPGRLDRIVRIDLPDALAVEGILRQHLAGALADEDLGPVAAIGAGATGAEIAGWAAGARMAARSKGQPMVLADLVGRIAPPETRSPAELLAVARHEAGHVAMLCRSGLGEVTSVSLVPKGAFAGHTSSRLRETSTMSADEIDRLVVFVLGGRAADEHWGRISSGAAGGPGSDLAHATALVAGKHASWGLGSSLLYRGDKEEAMSLLRTDGDFRRTVEADLARLYAIARDLVGQDADVVDRVARRLVERRVLGGDEVRRIIAAPASPGGDETAAVGGLHE